jgi:Sulfotransferase domain
MQAIMDVTSARVVIDSSKIPSHALLLRRIRSVDLRVVHLVRDSRGVAFSWQKHVRKAASGGEGDYLYRFNPASASIRWVGYNGITHAFKPLGVPYIFMRYEELVRDPRRELERILHLVGTDDLRTSLSFLHDREVELQPNHTVDGNPIRFLRGPVEIRPDHEWKQRMDPRDRRIVTAMTLPLLLAYRYPMKG